MTYSKHSQINNYTQTQIYIRNYPTQCNSKYKCNVLEDELKNQTIVDCDDAENSSLNSQYIWMGVPKQYGLELYQI